MRILDMTLYRNIDLRGLDEVRDTGQYIVFFETAAEYLGAADWFRPYLALPRSRLRELPPAERIDWMRSSFVILVNDGSIEHVAYEELGKEATGSARPSAALLGLAS